MTFETSAVTEKVLNSSDGTVIYATASGNPKLPALVFVHGFALSAMAFAGLFQEQDLLSRFYLVAYDARGHGRSGKPLTAESYDTALYAADFETVVKAFNLHSTIVIGWSIGGSVISDILTNLPTGTVTGAVYLQAVPFLGPVIQTVATPYILGILPSLLSTDDVAVSLSSRSQFIDACFNDSTSIPTELKWSWLGSTLLQPPAVANMVVARVQDPAKLFEAGAKGFPVLVIRGTNDQVVQGDLVEGILREHFTKLEVHVIEGGSHAPFIDSRKEFVAALVKFSTKIFSSK